MNWQIPGKRRPKLVSPSSPIQPDFNLSCLAQDAGPTVETSEGDDDLAALRDALSEPGPRVDYMDFRRDLGR